MRQTIIGWPDGRRPSGSRPAARAADRRPLSQERIASSRKAPRVCAGGLSPMDSSLAASGQSARPAASHRGPDGGVVPLDPCESLIDRAFA